MRRSFLIYFITFAQNFTIMKKIILLTLVALTTATSFAQTKVGTVDVEYILSNMTSDLATVSTNLKTYEESLSVELKQKMDSYETMYAAYEKNQAGMDEASKQAKQTEIVTLENDIVKYRQNGTQLLQIRRDELLGPLYQKIGAALDAESKAQGYTQVFTLGSGALGYADPNYDLTKTVMTRMGVTEKAPAGN